MAHAAATSADHSNHLPAAGELLQAAFESLPVGVLLTDRAGTIILVNTEVERLFGYRRQELTGQSVEVLVPARLRGRHGEFRGGFHGHRAGRAMGAGRDLVGLRKDGVEIPIEIGLNTLENRDGPLVVASIVGIKTRKQMEESAQRLAAIVESADDAIISKSLEGTILTWNRAAERMFGYTAAESVGRHISLIVPAERHGEIEEILSQVGKGERVEHHQTERLRKDGARIPISLTVSPIRSADGAVVGASKIARDITRQKRVEEALRRSNEDLERFAYVASHDLQEPLRTIASYVQLLENRYGDRLDADAREFIGYAVDGATRMRRLIDDLLAFSRVGTGAGPMAPCDAGAALDAALRGLGSALDDAQAVVARSPLPSVQADPGQLETVFSNLIANAVKFRGAAAPRIRVSAARDGPAWAFSVVDNGIGIEPEYFERIFVMFQRLHTRQEYPGTGIGLAICKKIVERHGGRIWVESEPGRGSTFRFTLPAAPEP